MLFCSCLVIWNRLRFQIRKRGRNTISVAHDIIVWWWRVHFWWGVHLLHGKYVLFRTVTNVLPRNAPYIICASSAWYSDNHQYTYTSIRHHIHAKSYVFIIINCNNYEPRLIRPIILLFWSSVHQQNQSHTLPYYRIHLLDCRTSFSAASKSVRKMFFSMSAKLSVKDILLSDQSTWDGWY